MAGSGYFSKILQAARQRGGEGSFGDLGPGALAVGEDAEESGYDGLLGENMTVCLESCVGEPGGPQGVKLEEQVLVTATGAEVLSTYPLEDEVLG